MSMIDSQTTSLIYLKTSIQTLLCLSVNVNCINNRNVWNSKEAFQILRARCDLKQQATKCKPDAPCILHRDDLAFCCWHRSSVQATSCQKYWDGVMVAADRTGISRSASGHHDDSTVWSTLGWWDGSWEMTGRWDSDVSWLGRPVDAGDRHYSPLFPLSPLASLLSRPLPNPLHCCRAPWIIPETNADEHLFPWWPRGCCKDCRKAFSLTLLCLGDNGSQTHTPLVFPSHYTLLHSPGSADRCSMKQALTHKTHCVLSCVDYYGLH